MIPTGSRTAAPRPEGCKATGGRWDRSAWPIYFVATGPEQLFIASALHQNLLVAMNEIEGPKQREFVRKCIDAPNSRVFIDSGVFWLSTSHAKKHGLSMDQALSLSPNEIDGFDDLFDRYVGFLSENGDRVWGYIEIDQGGRENKIKTRARLEALGLRPIPVYHPLNDGWDYFDYLAERYDRICFGNVVQASVPVRMRLLATAWERRRKYPHLWIHALGLTPSDLWLGFPTNSCDSSTWIEGLRWGTHKSQVCTRRMWETGAGFVYKPGVESKEHAAGYYRALKLYAYDAAMMNNCVEIFMEDYEQTLGADIGGFIDARPFLPR